MDHFITDHMMKTVKDSGQGTLKYLHGQSQVSKDIADKWKTRLSQSELNKMSSVCANAIEKHSELTMFNQSQR